MELGRLFAAQIGENSVEKLEKYSAKKPYGDMTLSEYGIKISSSPSVRRANIRRASTACASCPIISRAARQFWSTSARTHTQTDCG
ncbi:MAG: hypothetical protein ACLTLL_11465 [Acutalibacteraceae bacterium]